MNINEQSILSYAEVQEKFSIGELTTYLESIKIHLKKSVLYWHINQLITSKKLARVGYGVYALVTKNIFSPELDTKAIEIYKVLQKAYPFARFCIYSGANIATFQHHLSENNITYVETNREATESVFNFLKDRGLKTYLKPDRELIYNYVDLKSEAIFVKPLISESPLQKINNIPFPTIEKLLVDIYKDNDFFYLQGSESSYILENAFSLYSINKSKLLRYASRRGIKMEIENEIKSLEL